MAYTRGRCVNVDYCTLADGKRDIEVPVGEDFICPECARPLKPPPTREGGGNLNLAMAGAAVALVLIGGGIYAGYRLSEEGTPASRSAVVAPAPVAAPVVAPQPEAAAAAVQPAPLAAAVAPAKPEQAVLLRLAAPAKLSGDLAPRLAAAYLSYLGDTNVGVHPDAGPGETSVSGQRLSRPEAISIVGPVNADGDASAEFTALGKGEADAVVSVGRVTQAEVDAARAAGDMTAAASEHAIGLEGEAIIVNPRNPVSQLSMTQLRGVLDGTITAWPGLGGNGRIIHLLREVGSSSLADLVPGAPAVSRAEHHVREPAAAVADDVDAIAIVPLSRAGQMKRLAIAAVGAPPALPTPANLASEAYPLARRVYLYTPASGSNPFVQRFAKFALTPDGQGAVAEAGLVPVVTAAPVVAPVMTPKEHYKQLVAGATRLAADLHFEANSNKLDLHSGREVDRVWNFMMSDHTPSDHLILLGFADNQGTPEANMALSKQRARAVADVFTRRGLPPGQIWAFGSDLPIADNATEEGREKNRRVEVFLRP